MSDVVKESCGVWTNVMIPTQPFSGLQHSGREGSTTSDPCTLRCSSTLATGVLAGVLLTRGKFFYEVVVDFDGASDSPAHSETVGSHRRRARRVAKHRPYAVVGFVDMEHIRTHCKAVSAGSATAVVSTSSVGSDPHSWGYDMFSKQACNGSTREWGSELSPGDVIGVAVDMDDGVVSFGLNGDWSPPMGACFNAISVSGGLVPAVSLGSRGGLSLKYVSDC
jgi:hypothetical protein